jgi:uracil-DNA glycosylase
LRIIYKMLGERKRENMETIDIQQSLEQTSKRFKPNAWEDDIPPKWKQLIEKELLREYFIKMIKKIKKEEEKGIIIYPKCTDRFNFMRFCDPLDLKVVIIGQDPYHGVNQAHGLSFSVQEGVKKPPSLVNIYKELKADLGDGFDIPDHGNLEGWARQGVLLLNASLTVIQAKPNSHAKYGWMNFTDAIIRELNRSHPGLVFMLWVY